MTLPLIAEGGRVFNAQIGETVIFPHTRESVSVAEVEILLAPGAAKRRARHAEPNAILEIEVVEGALTLTVGKTARIVLAGESATIPPRAAYAYGNGHGAETRLRMRYRPARQYLRFLLNKALGAAKHPEWHDADGEPRLLLRALTHQAYPGYFYTTQTPIFLQKALFAALAPLARLKGYSLAVPPRPAPAKHAMSGFFRN